MCIYKIYMNDDNSIVIINIKQPLKTYAFSGVRRCMYVFSLRLSIKYLYILYFNVVVTNFGFFSTLSTHTHTHTPNTTLFCIET